MIRFMLIVTLLLPAVPAAASSPAAWRQLERQAERSCVRASSLSRPRVSNAIIFDDSNGMVALLVSGTHPQRHMAGASGTELCLYDRMAKIASVQDADGWGERRRTAGPASAKAAAQ